MNATAKDSNISERKIAFGDILKAAMDDKGIGTREMVSRMGGNVRRQYVQSVIAGRVEPTLEMWKRICAALDVA